MPDLTSQLKSRLCKAKRIAVLGIGSELRADDAAGMLVAQGLKDFHPRQRRLRVFLGSTAPENITGEIKEFRPTHLLIVDSADARKKAGSVILLQPQDLKGVSFSTHQLPLSILARYLSESFDCEILIIGIQPKSVKFGSGLSKEVRRAVKSVAQSISTAISGRK